MIWVDGKILPDDGLAINAADRTFEHGLGLFETLRTWGGRPALLDRHRARMLRSAEELRLPIDPASLPDAEAVRAFLEAEGAGEDRLLRITASGGTESGKSIVWMRSAPLPGPLGGEAGASVLVDAWKVALDDPMARHKSLNYWPRRLAYEEARRQGCDETLSGPTGGRSGDGYFEGSRTNLFAIQGGGSRLFGKSPAILNTTSPRSPIVPGIMRGEVLKVAGDLAEGSDQEIPIIDDLEDILLDEADEVFLTNSVRGIIPVARAVDARTGKERHRWPSPGPWTQRLQDLLAERLRPDRGETP